MISQKLYKTNKGEMNTHFSIITANKNGLNSPIKMCRKQ
jgi:hypothetical protein